MAAFKATFSDMKLVKTRQIAQLIFEIPLSDFDAAYEVLGGLPNPSNERWFGIAALDAAKIEEKPKRTWEEMQPQQQAGIRCNEPTFIAFLKEARPDDWREASDAAECVRLICDVHSRVELGTNQHARIIWRTLDSQYQAWLARERVGA
jgi:hypothetical protein